MQTDDRKWKIVQRHLRYNDEEMAIFKGNPRNSEVLADSSRCMIS